MTMELAVAPIDRRPAAARILLIILWGAAAVAVIALVPSAFTATQTDWQFGETAKSLSDRVSYETLTAAVTGIRLALVGFFLAAAALMLSRRPQRGPLLAALMLTTLPFTFNLVRSATTASYPSPWSGLLSGFTQFLGYLGAAALILLIYLFPDGRFYPSKLRIALVAGLVIILGGIAASQFSEADAVWIVFMIAFLATILLGIAGQVARYRAADPLQRRQSAGFLFTLAMLPIWIVVGVTGASPLLNLALGFALLALLPAGLLLGVARGLWGGSPSKRPVVLFAGALVAILLVSAATAGSWWRANQPLILPASALTTVEPQIVVFDTDMGMDDISALLYLLQHPAVDLRAITVNGVAFAHCGPGVHNVLGLLEVARAPEIPVSCGREEPYPGGRPAPDGWRKGADNLYGGQVRTGSRVTDPRPAADLLAETIASAPGDIVIVALGPLTNLAEAFEADPSLAQQVKRIVIMGGAVDAPGNVASEEEGIDNAFAEWNIFADPVAADIVLSSGAPITLVPLDATNDVPFTRGFYERLRGRLATRPATFVYNLMYMNQWWLDGGMYWWDTLAAAAALDESLVTLRDEKLDVVTEAGPEIGRTFATESGSLVQVAVAADARHFEALFLEVLNHER